MLGLEASGVDGAAAAGAAAAGAAAGVAAGAWAAGVAAAGLAAGGACAGARPRATRTSDCARRGGAEGTRRWWSGKGSGGSSLCCMSKTASMPLHTIICGETSIAHDTSRGEEEQGSVWRRRHRGGKNQEHPGLDFGDMGEAGIFAGMRVPPFACA
jgi:hypothetical protein